MDKIERRLDAITKLMQAGMKMLVRNEQAIQALIDAQMRTEARMARTDAKLERLIQSLSRRNGNGHKR